MKISIKKLELALARNCLNVSALRQQGIHSSVLCKLKSGQNDLKPASVGKIATALNCDPMDLIEED